MACYPNFLNNFQDIYVHSTEGYEKIIERIKENSEYSRYGIDWDIQTYDESENSFYNKNHPMQFDSSYHRIGRRDYFYIEM